MPIMGNYTKTLMRAKRKLTIKNEMLIAITTQQLVSMGFNKIKVVGVVRSCKGDLNKALEQLVWGGMVDHIMDHMEPPPPLSPEPQVPPPTMSPTSALAGDPDPSTPEF